MRRYLYLSTAVAGVMMTAWAGASFAQCVTTQNCAELGYTETSCPDGTGIKCPFGDTFACTGGSSEITPEQCTQLGFTHTCTGTNETGGSGTACGGKYTSCTCASGYEWNGSSCILNGAHGELYYCNGTVVGIRASGMNFYVAMRDLKQLKWCDANCQCQTYFFCSNVRGTLPTEDQLLSIYNNKSTVNNLLSTNGGTQLTDIDYYWSSTESFYSEHSIVNMSNGNVTYQYSDYYLNVRPVLTSW